MQLRLFYTNIITDESRRKWNKLIVIPVSWI